MAFTKKTWKDRLTEYPTRRRITKSDGTSELVTVSREEGTVSQAGDAFSAANMNDLENRIAAGLATADGSKTMTYAQYQALTDAQRKDGTTYYIPDAPAGGSGESVKDSNMYYDPTTDTKYLKGQDGEWVGVGYGGLLNTYLIFNGEINTDVVSGYNTSAGTKALTVVSENGELKITSASTTYWCYGIFNFTKAISVTDKSKLCMTYNFNSSNWQTSTGGDFKMCVSVDAPTSYSSNILAYNQVINVNVDEYTKSGTATLDLTNISGSVYVWLFSSINYGSTNGSWTMKIENMWFE